MRKYNKSERLAFVKSKYGMSPKDVLAMAYYSDDKAFKDLKYPIIMVGELNDKQWDAIIKEAEDFEQDNLLHSYLGHKKIV